MRQKVVYQSVDIAYIRIYYIIKNQVEKSV